MFPETISQGDNLSQRKKAEDRLHQSEERLRKIFESSNDGIMVEENERIIFANKSYLDLFGYESSSALVGLHVSSVIARQDLERVLTYGRSRVVGAYAPSKYEFRGRKKNGIEFDVEASVSVSTSNGSTLVTTFISDIGDRKRLQVLMAAQKAALELVAGGAPLGETLTHLARTVEKQSGGASVASILLLDGDGRLRNGASPSLPYDYIKAIDGIKADVDVGTCAAAAASAQVVVTPDIGSDPRWNGIAHLPIALGLVGAWSMPIIARDGHVLGTFGTYFKECRPPTDLEKNVVEVVARTAALAIEQKQSEQNLRESESQLGLIADAIPLLVSFVGYDQRYRFVNRAYTEWFGLSRTQIVGRHLSEVLGPEAYQAILPQVNRALTGEPSTYEGLVAYRTGERFIIAKYIPETDPSTGEIAGFHAFVEDISARKKAEEVLRRSKKELESLVQERTKELETATRDRITMLRQLVNAQEDERRRIAREVHDQLGQQVTVLRLKLSAIKKSSESGETIHERIEEIRELARVLDADIGFLAWRSRPAVLDDLGLAAALKQYTQRWSANVNIKATFDGRRFGERRLTPEAETAFYRIMQEALNNVYKHARAGSVGVFLERKGLDAILIVEDDGVGFDSDRTYPAFSASGLGIVSMRERMALIGGSLEIESSNDAGTTIYATVSDSFRRS
ncbi:MAG TPA: PAS domain S-box protein [Pyrinomonadaceae bacterium]|nr:PAS domain S-box protein [Pyrinomonadaceae bacterium]